MYGSKNIELDPLTCWFHLNYHMQYVCNQHLQRDLSIVVFFTQTCIQHIAMIKSYSSKDMGIS